MPNYRLIVALSIFLIVLGRQVQCAYGAARPTTVISGAAAGIFSQFRQNTSRNSTRQTSSISQNNNENINSAPETLIQVREVLPTKLLNDIDPELNIDDHHPNAGSSSRNRRIWWRRVDVDEMKLQADSSLSTKKSSNNKEEENEHPLRTDLWKLQIQWFPRRGKSNNRRTIQSERHLQMEFHKNGQCRLMSVSSSDHHSPPRVWGVGTWISRPYVVSFSVPCKELFDDGQSYKTNYIFTAQLHHNPFGKQPKFQQGTILLEKEEQQRSSSKQHNDVLEYDEEQDRLFVRPPRKRWFRPVVGKFTGEGIGEDTLDYSYSKRK